MTERTRKLENKGRITAAIIAGIFLVSVALITHYSSINQLDKTINATKTAEYIVTRNSINITPTIQVDTNNNSTIELDQNYGVQFGTDFSESEASGNFNYLYNHNLDPIIVKTGQKGEERFITYAINLSYGEALDVKELFEKDFPDYGDRDIVLITEIIFGCLIVEDPDISEIEYLDCSD